MHLSLCSRANQDVHIFRASRASDLDECGYSRVIGMLSCVFKRVDMGEGTRYMISTLVMAKTSDSTEDTVPCRGSSVTHTCIHTYLHVSHWYL